MASRGFFGYDPYDYYYPASPYAYSSYPYYRRPAAEPAEPLFYPHRQHRPDAFFPDVAQPAQPLFYPHRQRRSSAPTRNDGAFHVEATEPATARRGSSQPASFPVEVTGPDPPASKRRAPSAEEAAVRLQAAARGHAARRMVREVRAVEQEAEAVAARVAAQSEALRGDARARVGVGEELMRLLLRLDGVRGAREYRRRVTKRVLALQDAVDALESSPPAMVTDAPEAQVEEIEDTGMALELPVEATTEENTPAAEIDTSMEVDGVSPVAVAGEADHTEPELAAEGEKITEEGEWEMVATGDSDVSNGEEGPAPASAKEQQHQEQAGEEKTEVASAADGLDAKKLMEMVAALCERSAQQCTLIGALAERVDTLERAVRRVEEADRRRRRTKKINKENKRIAKSFYSD